jgi:excinuclease ABC subunit C
MFVPQKSILERLEELPKEPGVYLMKDSNSTIIYIGKAKSLNHRVRSYFSKSPKDHRAATLMVPFISNIDWIITHTEIEALLLEAKLVQKHQPKYNVRLKDDKHYPYIRFSIHEEFPRLEVVRKVKSDGANYYGPYLNPRSMRKALSLIPKLFRIRECNMKLPPKKWEKPCLSYHIKRCDAPCANLCSSSEYSTMVKATDAFLNGKYSDIIDQFKTKMQEYSELLEFEKAAKYRDQIHDLEALQGKHKMDLRDENLQYDFISYSNLDQILSIVLLEYRGGKLDDRKNFIYECPLEDHENALEKLLWDHYSQSEFIPQKIYFGELNSQKDLWESYLSEKKGKKIHIDFPVRGEKKSILDMAKKNAHMLLIEQITRNAKIKNISIAVELLQHELKLTTPPRYIEGFDISHLGGTNTVASQVVFRNGKPSRNEYRKYKIQTVDGINDFASMYEVISRRCRRIIEENLELPDLILIDGGKGQINSAWKAMHDSGLEIPMIGLAKRIEEVFFQTLLLPCSFPMKARH